MDSLFFLFTLNSVLAIVAYDLRNFDARGSSTRTRRGRRSIFAGYPALRKDGQT